MTTEEGGAQPKEYAAKYMAVRAGLPRWMGAPTGRAECHDPQVRPVLDKRFLQPGGLFADVQEAAVGKREPGMLLSTPDQESQLSSSMN